MTTYYAPGPSGIPCQYEVDSKDAKHFARLIYYEIFELGQYNHPPCVPAKGETVLDIGANIGMYSDWALKRGAKVYAIEPELSNYNCLVLNCPQAISYHAAMTSTNGQTKFWHTSSEGGHTLYDLKRGDSQERVPAFTLSWFLGNVCSHIDVLKCDTEGAEWNIFSALPPKYFSHIGRIIMEFHHSVLRRDHPEFFDQFMKVLHSQYVNVEVTKLCPSLSIITAWR